MLPEVVAYLHDVLNDPSWANASSYAHAFGERSRQYVHLAAQQVSSAIGATPQDIVWTSGATEANNLAIKGAATFYRRQGSHLITMATEHQSVLDACHHLTSEGMTESILQPQSNGVLNLDDLQRALRQDTVLVSIMMVNNETGIWQDIAAIADMVHQVGALLHVDASQAVGRMPINVKALGVDLMTLSSHKAYGPMGVGALYVRSQPKLRLSCQIHGGGHQQGMRSGSLPVHQIAAMGTAVSLVAQSLHEDLERTKVLRDQLWNGLQQVGEVYLNGDIDHQVPHCLNVRVSGVHQDSLIMAARALAFSTGSACQSVQVKPSHVLLAMGLTHKAASQSIRLSIGRQTTEDDVAFAINALQSAITRLRAISP